jgi:FkbM family methyltransferase
MRLIKLISRRLKNIFLIRVILKDISYIRKNYKESVVIHYNNYYYTFMRLFSLPFFRPEKLFTILDDKFSNNLKIFLKYKKIENNKYFITNNFEIKIPLFKNSIDVLSNDFRELFYDNIYTSGFPFDESINDNSIILDLGSNIGAFAIYAASIHKNIKIISVEPDPKIFIELCENIRNNGFINRITPLQCCVSNFNGFSNLIFDEDCFTMTRVGVESSSDSTKVPTFTVDQLVEDLNLEKIDFIKMDIEGAEREALAGAETTIARFFPKLAISGYHRVDDIFHLVIRIKKINPNYNIIVNSKLHLYAF